MFESAELGHTVDKPTYKAEVPGIREALLNAQLDLAQEARRPVILVLSGADGSGKREVVHTLTEWMDPRHIQTHAMGEPSEEERERPEMWRFWRVLPPRGKIGVFFHSWYSTPVLKRVLGNLKAIYGRADELTKLIAVLDRLIILDPASVENLRDRGVVYRRLDCYGQAKDDLETYLRLAPDAQDAAAIREQLSELAKHSVLIH